VTIISDHLAPRPLLSYFLRLVGSCKEFAYDLVEYRCPVFLSDASLAGPSTFLEELPFDFSSLSSGDYRLEIVDEDVPLTPPDSLDCLCNN